MLSSAPFYQAYVEVVPESKNLRKTLAKEFGVIGDDGGRSAGRGLNKGILSAVGSLAAPLAIAFAGLGIGKLFSSSIDAASDLSETSSAVEQVFGSAATDVKDFSKQAAKALGQTEQQALGAAQTFGVFGKSAGLTGKPLANFSTGLSSLAGDMASFYNSSPEEAIDAIGAGLRGEAEPLRRFGVLLDDATLKAAAMKLGIYDGNGALTSQQRVLAAQSAIMDQTGIAQGDFNRTSDGLANQQKILAATFENTKAKIGTFLLPGMTSIVTVANDKLFPIMDRIIDAVGPRIQAAIETGSAKLSGFLDSFVMPADGVTIVGVIDALLSKFPALQPFADVVTALTPVLPALADAFTKVAPSLADAMPGLSQLVLELLPLIPIVAPALVTVLSSVADIVTDAGPALGEFTGFVADILSNSAGFYQFVSDGLGGLSDLELYAEGAQGTYGDMMGAILGWGQSVDNFFSDVGTNISGAWGMAVGVVKSHLNTMISSVNGAIGGMNSLIGGVGGVFGISIPQIAKVPLLAQGGVATKAGWAVVGDAGPELIRMNAGAEVRPLGNLGDAVSGSGGHNFNIYEAVSATATAMEVSRRQIMLGAV